VKFLFLTTFSSETLVEKVQLHCVSQNIEVVRINIEDFVPDGRGNLRIAIEDHDVKIILNEKTHFLSEFSLIWKRRISNNFLSSERVLRSYNKLITKELARKLMSEIYEVRDLMMHFVEKLKLPIINNYDPVCLSKPFQSIKATEFGLKSPSIVVSNSLTQINSFLSGRDAITKPIGGLGYMGDEQHLMSVRTTRLTPNYTEPITEEKIFPSFVQEYIKSRYELKCILVGEQLNCIKQYSLAGDIPTTDIKEAISANQIRKEEYQLDAAIASKVVSLCRYFKLDICTIDIIKSSQDEYAFIEINPDGVVEYYGDFLSKPIHEKIFQLLLKRAKSVKVI